MYYSFQLGFNIFLKDVSLFVTLKNSHFIKGSA